MLYQQPAVPIPLNRVASSFCFVAFRPNYILDDATANDDGFWGKGIVAIVRLQQREEKQLQRSASRSAVSHYRFSKNVCEEMKCGLGKVQGVFCVFH